MRTRRTPASRPSSRGARVLRDNRGVTVLELVTALALVAVAGAVSFGSLFRYQESVAASRAARIVQADLQLARGLAIRARTTVSLVVNESQRSYVIRDTAGTVFHRRDFGDGGEIELTALTTQAAGDSLPFDGRGILVAGGTPVIRTMRNATLRTLTVNALGKARIN